MGERALLNRVRKLKDLEVQKAALEKQIDGLNAEIQEQMQDTEQMNIGDYIVRWTRFVSSKFDSKAFKAEHKNLYSQYTKETESRRFTIA